MKLGFVSAILDGQTFEQVVDFAGENGFSCVEMACWPIGKADRRYAGVTHIDADKADAKKITYYQDYCRKKGVAISSLAYYPNTLDPDLAKRNAAIAHLRKLIELSAQMGINLVTTFVGRVQDRTVEENLKIFQKVWEPIVAFAEEKQVRIGIENCPMLFTDDQWPGGQNLATTPAIWRRMFAAIPSPYFGLNYDPSHFVWQQIDYIRPLYEFRDRIFHVHFKDVKLFKDKLNDVGIMATPLQYMAPKLPGLGDVDWSRYVSALTDIGYDGYACIEIEDKAFEGSLNRVKQSLYLSRDYLRQFVI